MPQNKKVVSSQKKLEYWILGAMLGVAMLAMMFLDGLRDFTVSLVFFVGALALPSTFDITNRYFFIPWLDSLNEKRFVNLEVEEHIKPQKLEYFPVWLRVAVWFFVGLVFAYAWSYFLPYILTLPFFFGRIARNTGWSFLLSNDMVWQYGWVIAFMVQYIATLIVDQLRREEYNGTIWNRFRYKSELEN